MPSGASQPPAPGAGVGAAADPVIDGSTSGKPAKLLGILMPPPFQDASHAQPPRKGLLSEGVDDSLGKPRSWSGTHPPGQRGTHPTQEFDHVLARRNVVVDHVGHRRYGLARHDDRPGP